MKYTAGKLRKVFSEHVATIEFTKVDGTNRVMNATLLSEYIGDQESDHVEGINPLYIRVWDVDVKGWRTVRLESVKSLKINGVEVESTYELLTE